MPNDLPDDADASWGDPPSTPQPLWHSSDPEPANFPPWTASCMCGARFLCFSHRQFACSCGRDLIPRGRAVRTNTFIARLGLLIQQAAPDDLCLCGGTIGSHHNMIGNSLVGICPIKDFMRSVGAVTQGSPITGRIRVSVRVNADGSVVETSVVPPPPPASAPASAAPLLINPGEET